MTPAPRRLHPALLPASHAADHAADANASPDRLPPADPGLPQPLPRWAIEAALDAGGRGLYGPMAETRLVERRGQG